MTLKEIKQQIATEKGFDTWRQYVLDCVMKDLTKEIEDEFEDEPYDEVARRYKIYGTDNVPADTSTSIA